MSSTFPHTDEVTGQLVFVWLSSSFSRRNQGQHCLSHLKHTHHYLQIIVRLHLVASVQGPPPTHKLPKLQRACINVTWKISVSVSRLQCSREKGLCVRYMCLLLWVSSDARWSGTDRDRDRETKDVKLVRPAVSCLNICFAVSFLWASSREGRSVCTRGHFLNCGNPFLLSVTLPCLADDQNCKSKRSVAATSSSFYV